jgi:tRNA nucleotidyltransferase (CCA-adding enzyme)
MMVLDAAAELRSAALYPEGFMMSALTHDFGKAVSTVAEGHKISAIGHEKTGVELTRQFLRRISNENKMFQLGLVCLTFCLTYPNNAFILLYEAGP